MKTMLFIGRLLSICIITAGCSSKYISTTWKNDHAFPGNYNKIMVAAIVNNSDTSYRKELENHFKDVLESSGYPAISSFTEFGTSLRKIGQEETYRELCDKGIDAVMTVALVDKTKSGELPYSAFAEPIKYYYNRIWHYKEEQFKIPALVNDSMMKYSWEMILFDLSTLQPHYIAQTRTKEGTIQQSMKDEFWEAMITRLRKERFLKKRPPVSNTNEKGPRAF